MDAEDRERWRQLSSYRANPPGLIGSDKGRRKVFAAGLQQANEFAEAASTAGYATKALPLFYCFGQAIRALAAAFVEGPDWKITSHGASFKGREKILKSIIEPQDEGKQGTIQVLCRLDGTTLPTEGVTLGQLWRASGRVPLDAASCDAPAGLTPRPPFVDGHRQVDASTGVLTFAIPQWSAADTRQADIDSRIDAYPVLRDLGAASAAELLELPQYRDRLRRVGEHAVYVAATARGFQLPGFGWAQDAPVLMMPIYETNLDAYSQFHDLLKLDGSQPLLPAMGGISEPGWLFVEWARLYALSNIVRYYPAEWMAALDVDTSELAVPLQRLSDDYEKWLPMMLLAIMDGKATRPPIGMR